MGLFRVVCLLLLFTFPALTLAAGHRLQAELLSAEEPNATAQGASEPGSAEEKIEHKLQDNAKSTIDGVKKLENYDGTFKRDLKELQDTFLHGWWPSQRVLLEALAVAVLGLTWLGVYFSCIYTQDRYDLDGALAAEVPGAATHCGGGALGQVPDLVMVFHHPDHVLGDEGELMSAAQVGRLHMTDDPTSKHTSEPPRLQHSKSSFLDVVQDMVGGEDGPTKGAMRETLLQTLCAGLPKWGFDSSIFSSVDGDEVYVCVSLRRADVIDYFLVKHDMDLPLDPAVVAKLGIEQPGTPPPPRLRYDPRTVECLHQKGILSSSSPEELYAQYTCDDGKGSVMLDGVARIRLIFQELSSHFNLEAAVEEDMMACWYPAHDPASLDKLCRTCQAVGAPLRMAQPLVALERYFGSRLAFIMAWNSTYCKVILGLVPVALAMELLVLLMAVSGNRLGVREQALGFSIVLTAWGRIALNLWSREEAFFATLWGASSEKRLLRPQFRGELKPSRLDSNNLEPSNAEHYVQLWRLLSTLTTVFFCAFVAISIFAWNRVFEGNMNALASVCLSLQIIIFQALYNGLVGVFLDWENHKWQEDYYNSYLWKQFLFQSVNRYAVFFFLIVEREKAGCADADACLLMFQGQLTNTLVVLSISEMVTAVLAALKVKFLLWKEARDLASNGAQVRQRPFAEEQSKYATFRIREQVESMVQLVLSLGFVLLFGCVEPMTVPLCFAVFYVQLRASGHLLLHWAQRPFPRRMAGIGAWQDAVKVLMRLGVCTTGFLLTVYGNIFEGADVLARVSGFCIVVVAMGAIWALVDFICPPHDGTARLLSDQQRYVQRRITSWGHPVPAPPAAQEVLATSSPVALAGSLGDVVRAGEWSEIPKGDGSRRDEDAGPEKA